MCYGRSRSFKVIEIGTKRKHVFLLVFRCNYVPIFYRVLVQNVRFSPFLPTGESRLKPSEGEAPET